MNGTSIESTQGLETSTLLNLQRGQSKRVKGAASTHHALRSEFEEKEGKTATKAEVYFVAGICQIIFTCFGLFPFSGRILSRWIAHEDERLHLAACIAAKNLRWFSIPAIRPAMASLLSHEDVKRRVTAYTVIDILGSRGKVCLPDLIAVYEQAAVSDMRTLIACLRRLEASSSEYALDLLLALERRPRRALESDEQALMESLLNGIARQGYKSAENFLQSVWAFPPAERSPFAIQAVAMLIDGKDSRTFTKGRHEEFLRFYSEAVVHSDVGQEFGRRKLWGSQRLPDPSESNQAVLRLQSRILKRYGCFTSLLLTLGEVFPTNDLPRAVFHLSLLASCLLTSKPGDIDEEALELLSRELTMLPFVISNELVETSCSVLTHGIAQLRLAKTQGDNDAYEMDLKALKQQLAAKAPILLRHSKNTE